MYTYKYIQMMRKSASEQQHTIAKGNTLYGIARQYGTTVDALVNANPGIDPLRLPVGGVLSIPQAAQATAPRAWKVSRQPYVYTAVSGDNPSVIAQRNGVRTSRLMEANPGMGTLMPGTRVNIPLSDVDWFGRKHNFDYTKFTPLSTEERDALAMVESSGGRNLVLRDAKGNDIAVGPYQIEKQTYDQAVKLNPALAKYKWGPDLYDRKVSDMFMDTLQGYNVPRLQWKTGRPATRNDQFALWNRGYGGYGDDKAKAYVAKVNSYLANSNK